jgi:hypothetical protein
MGRTFTTYLFNRIPVMAPILAQILGEHFSGEHISLKNETFLPPFQPRFKLFQGHVLSKKGPFAPFLATIQPLSSAHAFLPSESERKLLCMGRTFTVACPYLLNDCPFQLSFS